MNWLDRRLYPFESHYFETGIGRMHYVDEGKGRPVVFVHGNLSWSFAFRKLVGPLSEGHRCIAPDHLGFGLSDKPPGIPMTPQAHADRFEAFMEHMDLHAVTLVVHEAGGPIGLAYALKHPARISSIVVMNSWLWPVGDDKDAQKAFKLTGSGWGRLLNLYCNYGPKVILPALFVQQLRLTDDVRSHYAEPFKTVRDRESICALGKGMLSASDWYRSLWAQKDKLAEKPTLLLWGTGDHLFDQSYLERWQNGFPGAETALISDSGRMTMEEQPAETLAALEQFLLMLERKAPAAHPA